jgi:hypothetical protein
MSALASNCLAINLKKCVEILSHTISAAGSTHPKTGHTTPIRGGGAQASKQLLRSLGMVNFCRSFSPRLHLCLRSLTHLLKGGTKTLELTDVTEEAFQSVKHLLAMAVPLQHPAPNAELSLATENFDSHLGGVMQQKSGDHWHPLSFFSRNRLRRNLIIPLSIRSCLQSTCPYDIFAIFVKVIHCSFGFQQTTIHYRLPCLESQPHQQCHLAIHF